MQGGRDRHDWDSSGGGQNWEGLRGGYGANDGNDDDDISDQDTAGVDDIGRPDPRQWPLEGFQQAAAFGHQPGPTHGATSASYQPSASFQQQGYQQRPMGAASFGYRGEYQPSGGYPTGPAPGAAVAYQPSGGYPTGPAPGAAVAYQPSGGYPTGPAPGAPVAYQPSGGYPTGPADGAPVAYRPAYPGPPYQQQDVSIAAGRHSTAVAQRRPPSSRKRRPTVATTAAETGMLLERLRAMQPFEQAQQTQQHLGNHGYLHRGHQPATAHASERRAWVKNAVTANAAMATEHLPPNMKHFADTIEEYGQRVPDEAGNRQSYDRYVRSNTDNVLKASKVMKTLRAGFLPVATVETVDTTPDLPAGTRVLLNDHGRPVFAVQSPGGQHESFSYRPPTAEGQLRQQRQQEPIDQQPVQPRAQQPVQARAQPQQQQPQHGTIQNTAAFM